MNYLHYAKKTQKHFVCGHFSFCSVVIKARLLLLFRYKTACGYSRDEQGNGYGSSFFYYPCDQGLHLAALDYMGNGHLPGNSN